MSKKNLLVLAFAATMSFTGWWGQTPSALGQAGAASAGDATVKEDELVKRNLAEFDEYLAKLDKVMTLTGEQKKEARAKYEAAIREYLRTHLDRMNNAAQEAAAARKRADQRAAEYNTLAAAYGAFARKTIEGSIAIPPDAQATLATNESVKTFEQHLAATGVKFSDEQKKKANEKFTKIMSAWDKEHYAEYHKRHQAFADASAGDDQAAKDKAQADFGAIGKERWDAYARACAAGLDVATPEQKAVHITAFLERQLLGPGRVQMYNLTPAQQAQATKVFERYAEQYSGPNWTIPMDIQDAAWKELRDQVFTEAQRKLAPEDPFGVKPPK